MGFSNSGRIDNAIVPLEKVGTYWTGNGNSPEMRKATIKKLEETYFIK